MAGYYCFAYLFVFIFFFFLKIGLSICLCYTLFPVICMIHAVFKVCLWLKCGENFFSVKRFDILRKAIPKMLALVSQSDAPPTGDQIKGLIPAGSGNILMWRLIMKYLLPTHF